MIPGSTSCRALKQHRATTAASTAIHEIDQAIAEHEDHATEGHRFVPPEHREVPPRSKKSMAEPVPPHRSGNDEVPLKEELEPHFNSLSQAELQAHHPWIDGNLSKGFIISSASSADAPIKRKDESLRPCVDYNEGTSQKHYPLPPISMELSMAQYYTTLDTRGAYNLRRVAKEEEWKTAFRTRYGLSESLVMPFRVSNAPTELPRYMNDVLHPPLDNPRASCVNAIPICCESRCDHQIDEPTARSNDGVDERPEAGRTEVAFLGLIITGESIKKG